MAACILDAGGVEDPTRTLGMDWSHSPWAGRRHYTTSLNLEPRGEKETRTTEKHVAPRSGSRRQRNWIQRGTIGEIGPGPECLAESCWRPVPHEGRRRLWLLVDLLIDELTLQIRVATAGKYLGSANSLKLCHSGTGAVQVTLILWVISCVETYQRVHRQHVTVSLFSPHPVA